MSSFTLDPLTVEEVLAGRLPSNPHVVPAEAYAVVYRTRTRGKKLCDTHHEDCDVGMHDSDDMPKIELDATTAITKTIAPVVLPPYPPTDLSDQDAVKDSFLCFMRKFYDMPVIVDPWVKVELNSIAPELREKHRSSGESYNLFEVLSLGDLLSKIRSQIPCYKSSDKLRVPCIIMYRFMTPIEFGDLDWNLYRDVNARHHDGSSNAPECETWYTKFLIKFLEQCNHIGQIMSQAAEQKTWSGRCEDETIRNVYAKVIIWYDDAKTTKKGWTGAHLWETGVDLDSPDAVDRLIGTDADDKMLLD